jgi:hypothetical protein
MATYDRREVTKVTIEFVVPVMPEWGACWVEVYKAVRAAHQELWQAGVVPEGKDASDDTIRIRPGDEEVIVFYERSETRNT